MTDRKENKSGEIAEIKYGYPPDKTQKAIDTVIEQAELMVNHLVEE